MKISYIVIIIFFLLFLLYFLPVTVKINFHNVNKNINYEAYLYILYVFKFVSYYGEFKSIKENDRLEMKLKTIFGIPIFSLIIDVANLTIYEKKPVIKYKIHKNSLFKLFHEEHNRKIFSINDVKKILHLAMINKHDFQNTYINTLKSLSIRKLNFNLEFGFNDAAFTSIVYGLINIIVYNLFSKIYYYSNFRNNPSFSINPNFGKLRLVTSFNCILDFRYGNIIINSIKFLKNFKRR